MLILVTIVIILFCEILGNDYDSNEEVQNVILWEEHTLGKKFTL